MLNWVTQTWKMFRHRDHGESYYLSFSCSVLIIMITLWVTIALNSPVKRKLPHLLPRCLSMSRLNISFIGWIIFFSPAICLVSTKYHVKIHSLRAGSHNDQPNLVYIFLYQNNCSFSWWDLIHLLIFFKTTSHKTFWNCSIIDSNDIPRIAISSSYMSTKI